MTWTAIAGAVMRVGSHRALGYTAIMTSGRVGRVVVASLLAGCGPGQAIGIEGFSDGFADEIGDGDGDPTDTSTGDGDGDPTGEASCPSAELPPLTSWVFDDTFFADGSSAFPPLCFPDNTSDRTLLWVAPESGMYQVALWSEVPLEVALVWGDCQGSLLGCTPNNVGLTGFEAIAGNSYTFVIEGEQTGGFELQLEFQGDAPSCPVGQLFGPQEQLFGSTLGAPLEFGSECGGFESSDQAWLFIPEVSGLYRFDTAGSSFDTILHVFGDFCGGPLLACNDDNPLDTNAILDVELQAGQPYTIVVDGFGGQSGDYQLALQLLGAPAGLCEGADVLASALPVSLSWPIAVDFGDAFIGCAPAPFERRLVWTSPIEGLVRVRQDASPNFSGLAVFPGGCAEGQFECQIAGDVEPEIVLPVIVGQELLIVSEYEPSGGGEISLTIESADAMGGCGTPMPAGVPSQVSGTTNGSGNEYLGSCAFNPVPEREFWWTAPATGTYVIDTSGSSYDTLIFVREGGCNGLELACNDDTPQDLTSAIQLDLVEGQIISIFVDGFSGTGSFNLHIDAI